MSLKESLKRFKEKHQRFKYKTERPLDKFLMVTKSIVFACLILASTLLYMINERILGGIILALAVLYLILLRLDSLGREIKEIKKDHFELFINVKELEKRGN